MIEHMILCSILKALKFVLAKVKSNFIKMKNVEDVEFFICDECCQSEYLKYYVQKNIDSHGECILCKETKGVLDICHSAEIKSFTRFLIRYYYSEAEYNPKWGGVSFLELFSEKNFLFNIERYNTFLDDDFFKEVFEFFLDNLIDAFDHDHPVDLYYGYDDHGRSLYDFPHIDSKSKNWEYLKKKLSEYNYYLLEDKALKMLEEPLKKLTYVLKERSKLLRSRIGYDHKEVNDEFFDYPQKIKIPYKGKAISAPPVNLAEAGRANRQGISHLYLASNKDTAISEVRPAPGNYVSTGIFESKKELTLIDLRFIDLSIYYKNDEDFTMFKLFRDLATELSFPVLPSERNKYLMTQFLSDTIRKLGYDGLMFTSSISDGDNYVCFYPDEFEYIKDSSSLVKVTQMTFKFKDVDYHRGGLAGTYKEI